MSKSKGETAVRKAIIDGLLRMNANGMNQGTSGNISIRHRDRMLISPSATPYESMKPDMIASMPIDGDYGSWDGPLVPSTEWRFHLDILRARPEMRSVVHLHSHYCTVLAIARKSIPACHYMMAAFGGYDVRCSGYARYGSKQLSELALEALDARTACLLANHGMIAIGETFEQAIWRAVELETIAKQYYHSLLIGGPVLLSEAEIDDTADGFSTYGLQVSDAAKGKAA